MHLKGQFSGLVNPERCLGTYPALLEITSVTPPMGPVPIADKFGMGVAITMLIRSLGARDNERTIQYSTMRRPRSAYSSIYNASSSLSNVMAVMAQETRKVFSTDIPTYGYWFEGFVKGCHMRMGDDVKGCPSIRTTTEKQLISTSRGRVVDVLLRVACGFFRDLSPARLWMPLLKTWMYTGVFDTCASLRKRKGRC